MTRRDRIEILLAHYLDVEQGLFEVRGEGAPPGMCKAWNAPAYAELRRLLRVLWERFPKGYRQLSARYFRYTERRVAYCRRCGTHPVSAVGKVHSHPPGRSITLVGRIERVPGSAVNEWQLAEAVDWLERHWSGEAEIPASVWEIEREQRMRVA